MKANLFYRNSIFAALGYCLYTVSSNSDKLPNGAIAIYKGTLKAHDDVNSYHVSDNVCFCIS